MAFTQFTKCVDVKDKVYPGVPTVAAVLAAIAILVFGGGLSPYTAIPLLLIVIGFCNWWLYDRLLCLGGDRCAIGFLGAVEPSSGKSGLEAFDTDFSFNLVLAPHQYQELPPDYPPPGPPPFPPDPKEEEKKFKEALHRQIADDGLQGVLIKETATTGDEKTIFGTKKYDFQGYFSTLGGWSVKYTFQPYLHCEFEGAGVMDLLHAAEAALAFATAAAVFCAIPVVGWVVCAVLSVVAAIIAIVGVIGAMNDKAQPTVYDPVTGKTSSEMHSGSDILFVKGTWVFDTFHEGWNEIHPVKECYRIATARFERADVIDWDDAIASYMVAIHRWTWDATKLPVRTPIKLDGPPKPRDWTDWVAFWCDHVGTTSDPLTVAAQARPENQWAVHPLIDGCRPEPGVDPDPGPR
ncbi:hypothetical protein [Paraburkholderia ultramafica]|uniref:hypothetical protein n=1 Tax=Paraburkholderia ultramafica TaxID=1544867 RepID=UPI001581D0CC|nr:hypothetical protein [Paraburkholderia ultramafica]